MVAEPHGQVFLFSGHMIDSDDRPTPRFRPEIEPAVFQEIENILDALGATSSDIALCGGAAGGDIIFAEACIRRKLPLSILLPFDEKTFLERSVRYAGSLWVRRFQELKLNPFCTIAELSNPRRENSDTVKSPYEQNNIRLLTTALSNRQGTLHFICLWDQNESDGSGGTSHMYHLIREITSSISIINPTTLLPSKGKQ